MCPVARLHLAFQNNMLKSWPLSRFAYETSRVQSQDFISKVKSCAEMGIMQATHTKRSIAWCGPSVHSRQTAPSMAGEGFPMREKGTWRRK